MNVKTLLQGVVAFAPFLLLNANSELLDNPGLRGIVDEDETDDLDNRKLKALKFVGESHKSPEKYPLRRCRGDCDNDDECRGRLICFDRVGDEPVPGCTGKAKPRKGYCIKKRDLPPPTGLPAAPPNPTPSPTPFRLDPPFPPDLLFIGQYKQNPKLFPLGLCEGDCDGERQCLPGLKCFRRKSLEEVPGCKGTGLTDIDYCYDPTVETPAPAPLSGTPLVDVTRNNPNPKLSVCEGDCDSNKECRGGLKCFKRNGLDPVPGCTGEGTWNTDYCYDPNPGTGTPAPTPADPSGLPILTDLVDDNPDPRLGACQGDCDDKSDCQRGLWCMKRNAFEPVPGCAGPGTEKTDYCYDPNAPPGTTRDTPSLKSNPTSSPTPFSPTSGPTSSPTSNPTPSSTSSPTSNPTSGPTSGRTPSPTSGLPFLTDLVDDDPDPELSACEGDCDADFECQPGLKCMIRDAFEPVPGCAGPGSEMTDYCYDPDAPAGTTGDTPSPTPSPTSGLPFLIDLVDDDPDPELSACEGDCDADFECQPGLKCMIRDAFEPVPGCAGPGSEMTDYCYDPAADSDPS